MMPLWAWGLFVLGMFWLSVFLGTLAEWRQGHDIFEDDSSPPPAPTNRRSVLAGWLLGVVVIGLVAVSLVLMGPPYVAARVCIWLWHRQAEPGAAADRGRHIGFWDFIAYRGGPGC